MANNQPFNEIDLHMNFPRSRNHFNFSRFNVWDRLRASIPFGLSSCVAHPFCRSPSSFVCVSIYLPDTGPSRSRSQSVAANSFPGLHYFSFISLLTILDGRKDWAQRTTQRKRPFLFNAAVPFLFWSSYPTHVSHSTTASTSSTFASFLCRLCETSNIFGNELLRSFRKPI